MRTRESGLVLQGRDLGSVLAVGGARGCPLWPAGRRVARRGGWGAADRVGVWALPARHQCQRRGGERPVAGPFSDVRVAALPGVRSSAAWLGLDANPVIHGKVNPSFQTDGVAGSVDGEYFTHDTMTVLAGHLPPLGSTDEVALTPSVARLFGVGVGDRVTYQFENSLSPTNTPTGELSYRVAAIIELPPLLVDQFDQVAQSVLPPAATAAALRLPGAVAFSWVGVRVVGGSAGIPRVPRDGCPLRSTSRQRLHVWRPQTRHGPPAGPRSHQATGRRRRRPRRARRSRSPGARRSGPGPTARQRRSAGRRLACHWSYAVGERRSMRCGRRARRCRRLAARHRRCRAAFTPRARWAGPTNRPGAWLPARCHRAAGRRAGPRRVSPGRARLAVLARRRGRGASPFPPNDRSWPGELRSSASP